MRIAMNPLTEKAWDYYNKAHYPEALRLAEQLLKDAPKDPSALLCKAMSGWWEGGDHARTLRDVLKILKRNPDFAQGYSNLGMLYLSAGQRDKAEEVFGKALELSPDLYGAFYGYSRARHWDGVDGLIERMQEISAHRRLNAIARQSVDYGLAKVFNDLGQYDKAMKYCLSANAAMPVRYDNANHVRRVAYLENLKRNGGIECLPNSGLGTTRPIFIIGMPRSGTSLVETILERHSSVLAMGELQHTSRLEAEVAREIEARVGQPPEMFGAFVDADEEMLREKARRMLDDIKNAGSGSFQHFTDKMPPNGLRTGFIAQLFPNAKFIRMRRNPLDCSVSQLFARLPNSYGYKARLEWLGQFYCEYEAALDHWQEMMGDKMMSVSYEALVTDPEPVVRELLAFIGLEWQEACLHPEHSNRVLRTSSMLQVRNAINTNSIGRWRLYEHQLGPLIEALGGHEAIERYDNGGAL